jgi:hypothetical protein
VRLIGGILLIIGGILGPQRKFREPSSSAAAGPRI